VKLTDLNPRWIGAGGSGVTQNGQPVPRREGVGVMFNCPCGKHGDDNPVYVPFANPLDGGPAYDPKPGRGWQRTGDTFETLTLTPSILRVPSGDGPWDCAWHGFITNGEIQHCG